MKITWIGQASYLFEHEGFRLAIDPYLSDALAARGLPRLTPSPFTPESLNPDAVLCTHDHLDHFDPETIAPLYAAHPNCLFWGPSSVIDHCEKMGISGDLCRTLNVGESVECPPFSFTATNAYHSDEHAIGLIIEVDNRRIYFSGDTENKNYLAKSVNGMSGNEIDIAFICINGKMGNMNIDNAVKVMAEVRPAVAIPMHYGLFAGNTVDPAPFIRKCDAVGVKAALLEIGRGTDMSELLE